MSIRTTAYALVASTLVACVPTRRECTWGEVEDVPGACYTRDGAIWQDGEIIALDAATDADADAAAPDTGEESEASSNDGGAASEAGLDAGSGPEDGSQPDGGDAAEADAGCSNDFQCSQLSTTPNCHLETRTCVECIPGGLERTQCTNGRACNPDTFACTGAPRGSVNWCKPCITDTECAEQDNSVHRCVSMSFQGHALGSYCLRVAPENAPCPNPTSVVKHATSVLGVEDDYCFLDEERATCSALLDFGAVCVSNEVCGVAALSDGLCVSISAGTKRCTYACDSASDCSTSCIGTPGAQYCNPN